MNLPCSVLDKPIVEEKIIVAEKTKPIDPCTNDTTLLFESGSIIKMNKCYYLKIKDCFKYKEYRSAKAVQEAGLVTVDERSKPIESGGMMDIRFCSDTCLKKPIIVFMPVPTCLADQPMTLWTLNRNNRWSNSNNKLEIVKINGKDFYKKRLAACCSDHKISLNHHDALSDAMACAELYQIHLNRKVEN